LLSVSAGTTNEDKDRVVCAALAVLAHGALPSYLPGDTLNACKDNVAFISELFGERAVHVVFVPLILLLGHSTTSISQLAGDDFDFDPMFVERWGKVL
jgi:hypothetical protein